MSSETALDRFFPPLPFIREPCRNLESFVVCNSFRIQLRVLVNLKNKHVTLKNCVQTLDVLFYKGRQTQHKSTFTWCQKE